MVHLHLCFRVCVCAGTKKPATFVGASMALSFDSGSCYFNDTKWIRE